MKFIMLDRVEGNQIAVNVNSLVALEAHDEETTLIELSSGSKFFVTNYVSDILEAMNADIIIK